MLLNQTNTMNNIHLIPSLIIGIDPRFFNYAPLEENKKFHLTPTFSTSNDVGYITVKTKVENIEFVVEGFYPKSKVSDSTLKHTDIYDISLFLDKDTRATTTEIQDYEIATMLTVLIREHESDSMKKK